jgi:hypothetical protein
LSVVLYACGNCCLTLKEEHRLRVIENRVLRRIFGSEREEVTGDWRKLHSKELHLDNQIKEKRWTGHVACMVEKTDSYRM